MHAGLAGQRPAQQGGGDLLRRHDAVLLRDHRLQDAGEQHAQVFGRSATVRARRRSAKGADDGGAGEAQINDALFGLGLGAQVEVARRARAERGVQRVARGTGGPGEPPDLDRQVAVDTGRIPPATRRRGSWCPGCRSRHRRSRNLRRRSAQSGRRPDCPASPRAATADAASARRCCGSRATPVPARGLPCRRRRWHRRAGGYGGWSRIRLSANEMTLTTIVPAPRYRQPCPNAQGLAGQLISTWRCCVTQSRRYRLIKLW